jgi:hypothetical protein
MTPHDAIRLFTKTLETAGARPLRGALLQLCEVTGLVVANRPRDAAGLPNQGIVQGLTEYDALGQVNRLRFWLIDDQFHLGYQHALAALLFGLEYRARGGSEIDGTDWECSAPTGTLRCSSTTRALIDKLAALGPVRDWREPRVLELGSDVLLLDLRLWPDRDGQTSFMKAMVGLVERLGADDLSDAGFRRALNAARRIAKGGCLEAEALTLLPLLVNHADPALPIVVFSSTQQRTIAQLFAERPGVLATFAKPMPGLMGEDTANTQLKELAGALVRGVELHELRVAWRRIVEVTDVRPPSFCLVPRRGARQEPEAFNVPSPGASPYVDRGRRGLGLSAGEWRRFLRRLYFDYLVCGRWTDFLSIPHEFLEGALTPADRGVEIEWPQGREFARERLAIALQRIRHWKTHGHAARRSDRYSDKCGAVVAFLFLVDLIWVRLLCDDCPRVRSVGHLTRLRCPRRVDLLFGFGR